MKAFFTAMLALSSALSACVSMAAAGMPPDDARRMVDELEHFRFDRLGYPEIKSDSIHPVSASAQRPHRLLILPVSFVDKGFERYAGDPMQEEKNREWFSELLFAGGPGNPQEDTLSHYYRHQSRGAYNVTGDVFPLVQLDKPLHYYGRPAQTTAGDWRSDENGTQLVLDALAKAYADHPDFPWHDYDIWDPQDFDGDGNRNEADGYIDHFVLVVAGKAQSDCHGLYKLSEKLNVQSPADAFDSLTSDEQACADRLWPHRSGLQFNMDGGPEVAGRVNQRGGVPLGNGLWLLDYNMQSEYTGVETFIHEFGHSLGLPDIYARETSNSTGAWDVMSSTAGPVPQEMSSWSRMVLGWQRPCVVRPPSFGGANSGQLELKPMNDWSDAQAEGAAPCDSVMVILPPKYRDFELGPLGKENGRQAAYSGQGNDMNRSLGRRFDLGGLEGEGPVLLSMDLWFEIEAEWDYLYVEAARDGEPYRRLMPTDKDGVGDRHSVMPSAKGHEGAGSIPGFTGLSGDRDGDSRVEGAPGCDPEAVRKLAEDSIGQTRSDPCEAAQWITAQFDLAEYRGGAVNLRITYLTDGAAVENGALVDNVALPALGFKDDFEAGLGSWENQGFTLSAGSYHLAVPHFYLLEYRDPYASFSSASNYDAALTKPSFQLYPGDDGAMRALSVNYRPGVLLWYYNGEYLWSQNDPAELGPGRGYLLLVDSTPREFEVPAMPERYFRRENGWTWWEFDESAQPLLENAFLEVMCYERRPSYYSSDVDPERAGACAKALNNGEPPVEKLFWGNRQLTYKYTIENDYLPGPEREARLGTRSFYDLRIRDGKTLYRLYDRVLRTRHSADAPFALDSFPRGLEIYRAAEDRLTLEESSAFAPVSSFTDARPNRYLNPKLPFGGADIPEEGFGFELSEPGRDAPEGSVVQVNYRWRK